MIDQTNVKAPGWSRVVQDLLAPAADERQFLGRLVAILAQVSSAKQAVLFAIERGEASSDGPSDGLSEPRAVMAWPPSERQASGGDALELPPIDMGSDVRAAARATAESGGVRLFGLEGGAGYYGSEECGSVIAATLVTKPSGVSGDASPVQPALVVTLLTEPRSKQALSSTVAMVEVIAGYTHLHAARGQLRRAQAASAALDLAARLIATVNASSGDGSSSLQGFKAAAIALVNDVQRQIRADRVALGWVRAIGGSGAIRLVALSDTEHLDRRMAMAQKLEAAMDECLDQEQAILYPPPEQALGKTGSGEPLLDRAITNAHRELVAADARLKAVSVPLRDRDKVVGVLTMESSAQGHADVASIELLQAAMDLVSPILVVRESDDRPLHKRAYASTIRAGSWLVGARHTAWKLAGLALLLTTLFVTFWKTEYRVEAMAEVQPRVRATVAAPFDGVVATLAEGVAPGKRVSKGQELARLDTRELELRALDARARLMQAQKEADAALKQGNRQSEVQQASARAQQAEAMLRKAELDLANAVLRAPIDGVIIAGELDDKIGAAVRLGDALFQVASMDDMIVLARLSDRDIGRVRGEGDEGTPSTGHLATKADPATRHPFVIERVVPLAQAKDGKNTFELRGRLNERVPGLRPGMEGVARVDVGRHSLLYIGTRRLLDQARLWLWW